MDTTPPFADAVDTFRTFLRGEGISDSIRWIWRDFIYTRRAVGSRQSSTRPIYINGRWTVDIADVERYYTLGVQRGLGVALCVFCIAENVPYCFVYLPEDELDAEYRMMTSLKCQLPEPPPTAHVVRNRVYLTLVERFVGLPNNSWAKDVPTLSATSQASASNLRRSKSPPAVA